MKLNRLLWKYLSPTLKSRCRSLKHNSTRGFTLTEVLVSMIIASLILSGLLSLMVELVTTDAREIARTETQREMQMALDYISTDLREAVYVYDGDCLADEGSDRKTELCEGLLDYISVPDDSVPVMAFWKLEDLPESLSEDEQTISGRSHSLVVYYLTRNDENDTIWQGMGRLQRAVLSQYNSQGQEVAGYIDPEGSFDSWPGPDNAGGNATLRPVTLVDFVDDRPMDEIDELIEETGGASVECPAGYVLTPSDSTLDAHGFSGVRNIYSCVRDEIGRRIDAGNNNQDDESAFNQKVILFLRGNASGKPGIRTANEGFMPAIQTQVLNRSVRNKRPPQF